VESHHPPFPPLPEEFNGPSVELRFKFLRNPSDPVQDGALSTSANSSSPSSCKPETAQSVDSPVNHEPNADTSVPASERAPVGQDQDIQLGTAIRAENPAVSKSLRGKDAAAVLGATLLQMERLLTYERWGETMTLKTRLSMRFISGSTPLRP
jgi:hypothetical protein